MTQIQQVRPRMASPYSRRNRNPITRLITFCCTPSDRLAIFCLICLVVIILGVNLQAFLSFTTTNINADVTDTTTAVESTTEALHKIRVRGGRAVKPHSWGSAHHHQVQDGSTSNLPPLPDDPMPEVDAQSHHPLSLVAMDRWASTPLVGSFVHRQQDDTASSSTITRIHMPFMDLQTEYKKRPPYYVGATNDESSESSRQRLITYNQTFASPDCVVLTRKGNKYAASRVSANQDRIAISDYVASSDGDSVEEFWMGLFDGHGDLGHAVSHYAISEFPKRLEALRRQDSKLLTNNNVEATKTALKDVFLAVNANMPNILGAGSTGISIWKRRSDQQLFISNVGDSMAFVVSVDRSRRDVKVVYTTKPHKPNDPLERQRIESMGGEVQDPPDPQYSARLIIPVPGHPDDAMGLAMSRSLGDFDGYPYGLIAEPTTDVISLKELDPTLDYLVILASDGLLDRVTELEIARQMAESQLLTPNGTYLPLEAAERLILQSSQAWMNDAFGDSYRDDISLAVHRLRI